MTFPQRVSWLPEALVVHVPPAAAHAPLPAPREERKAKRTTRNYCIATTGGNRVPKEAQELPSEATGGSMEHAPKGTS